MQLYPALKSYKILWKEFVETDDTGTDYYLTCLEVEYDGGRFDYTERAINDNRVGCGGLLLKLKNLKNTKTKKHTIIRVLSDKKTTWNNGAVSLEEDLYWKSRLPQTKFIKDFILYEMFQGMSNYNGCIIRTRYKVVKVGFLYKILNKFNR